MIVSYKPVNCGRYHIFLVSLLVYLNSTRCDAVLLSILRRIFVSIAVLLVVCGILAAQFVDVHGGRFHLDGEEFRFTGTNAYFLLYEAALGNSRVIEEVFGAARETGMSVVRIWAFYDDPETPHALQRKPGVYSERVFRALDYLISRAAEYNLRLILVLTNNWEEYGGSMQYVRWSPTATVRDEFYTDDYCRQYYKQFVRDLITRTNSITGVRYKDDPAIFSWELINEPTSNDQTGRIVRSWIDEMAAYVKSIDKNHLVGIGGGGWDNSFNVFDRFLSSIPLDEDRLNWMLNGSQGVSYSMNIRSEFVDYATAHVYPDVWNMSLYQTVQWIRDLLSISESAGKPFVLGEFGKRANRAVAVETVFSALFSNGGSGILLWKYPYIPGYNSEGFSFDKATDSDAVAVLRNLSSEVKKGSPVTFDATVFDAELPRPFPMVRQGVLTDNVETIWYNVSVKKNGEEHRYEFGRRGSIEIFIRGIYKSTGDLSVRIRAKGDIDKIWLESHIRGQWLSRYSGRTDDYTDIYVPLQDLGLKNEFIERINIYSDDGANIYIDSVSIVDSNN